MSYIVKQMVRGKPYAYEVSAYWDKEKKQARQRRKYLGIYDENGNIVPKTSQREVSTCKTYGPFHLLHQLAKQTGLEAKLKGSFSNDAPLILAMAIMRIVEPESLRNVKPQLEESFLPEMLALDDLPTSQRLSNFLIALSKEEEAQHRFFRSLVQEEDALVFDVTSLSSRSHNLDLLEYGADYRSTGMPQMNLGLVVSLDSSLPIFYKAFPGSVNDVVTLKNLLQDVQELGVRRCQFVLDRGFYSEPNVKEMLEAGMEFIMPLPFGRGLAKRLVSQSNRALDDPRLGHLLDSKLYRVFETTVQLAGRTLKAFVIVSEERRTMETRNLYARLEDIEAAMNGKDWHPRMRDALRNVAKREATCFTLRNVDGKVQLERKRKAVAQSENRCGKTILLTSQDLDWQQALTHYRQRGEVENDFDQLKNELLAEPLRVSSPQSLRGLLFIMFVSLVLRSMLLERARQAKLLGKRWVDDMMLEMRKLKATRIGSVWRLSEVTKSMRDLLKALKIALPDNEKLPS